MTNEISEFANAIGAKSPNPGDKNYKTFRQVFRRSNYYILDGKFAIIKISRSAKPFWGVGRDFVEFLNNTGDYFLILLISNNEGWVFTKAEIKNHIDADQWRLREADNNYKINSPLPDKNSFISPSRFLKKIGLEPQTKTQ